MFSILLPLFKTESKWTVKKLICQTVAKTGLLKLKVRVAFHKLIGKGKIIFSFGGVRVG